MSTETTPTIAARSGPTTGVPERGKTIYTCPMHPKCSRIIRRLPSAAMTLEPKDDDSRHG